MGNDIPERWECYSNMGSQIPGTRFICFKVPLKEILLQKLQNRACYASADAFDVRSLMDNCSNLGLVIDLTNTDRYYDAREFRKYNVEHYKLKTIGKVIPHRKVVTKFFDKVETFLEKNKENDKLIGVHCTHGVNRTGYLICRYMIDQLGLPPDQAISDFNSARGHEQERKQYLDDLRGKRIDNNLYASNDDPLKQRFYGSGQQTPPYMPQRSSSLRQRDRQQGGWGNGPFSYTRSTSSSRANSLEQLSDWKSLEDVNSSQNSGYSSWSPYEGMSLRRSSSLRRSRKESEKPPTAEIAYQKPLYKGGKRRSRSELDLSADGEDEGEEEARRPAKSPKYGREYFQKYYRGELQPQYDGDFYIRGGGGIGPHRPPPRRMNYPTVEGRPRVYRGPRAYKTPAKERLRSSKEDLAKDDGNQLLDVGGPSRNPFSPGTDSKIFSPEGYERRRSSRFQPY